MASNVCRNGADASPWRTSIQGREASLREGGELKDLVPTALAYLGLTKPLQITGENLCK
jgi:bisphosphoglycerate-independent phosphoglycerate mutase (AlkP superfamily)